MVRAAVLYTAGPWFESRLPYQHSSPSASASPLASWPSGIRSPSARPARRVRGEPAARIRRTPEFQRAAGRDGGGPPASAGRDPERGRSAPGGSGRRFEPGVCRAGPIDGSDRLVRWIVRQAHGAPVGPLARSGAQPFAEGSATRPRKRIVPVGTSRRANRNGRSTRKVTGSPGPPEARMTTAVAAAASVPFSSTSMFAWWITAEMNSRSSVVIPEKSA